MSKTGMSENSPDASDPVVDHRLRVAVERVVRPVRCEEVRKTRMRNELLDHASERFREGVRRGLTRENAASEAIERMGAPAALTADLQATVPWGDRWGALLDRAVRRRRGVSYARHAAWVGCLSGLGFAMLLSVVGLAENGLAAQKAFQPDFVRVMLFLSASFAATSAIAVYFGGRVRDCLERRRARIDRKTIGWSLLAGLLMWVQGLALWLIVGAPAVMWSPVYGVCWTALSGIFAVSITVIALLDLHERREIDPWLRLEIE